MKTSDWPTVDNESASHEPGSNDPLQRLLSKTTPSRLSPMAVVIADLVALRQDGTPLICLPSQPEAPAHPARSVIDVNAAHVGKQVVVMFEDADQARPVILGAIRDLNVPTGLHGGGQVHVDADGEQLTVSARERLVLQCGSASITLTRAGKVIIRGSYVSNRSSGVLRLKGGSVQIN